MKNIKLLLLTIVAVALLLGAVGLRGSVLAADPQAAAAQDQPGSTSSQPAQPGMMGGKGMMGSKGMMGGGMMTGPQMMGGCAGMAMMNTDPKTRGQMMQIKGRMMKEMGDLMSSAAKNSRKASNKQFQRL